MTFNREQILALAPDAASAKSSEKIAMAASWLECNKNGDVIWGEFKGSANYQVRATITSQKFKCNCPSRKLPCKHSVGILLKHFDMPDYFNLKDIPDAINDWYKKVSKTETVLNEEDMPNIKQETPVKKKASQKSILAKEAKITKGLQELKLRMEDIVKFGISSLSPSLKDEIAKRMIDYQLSGISSIFREDFSNTSDSCLPKIVCRDFAKIYLAINAWEKRDSLPAILKNDLFAFLGYNQNELAFFENEAEISNFYVAGVANYKLHGNVTAKYIWLINEDNMPIYLLYYQHKSSLTQENTPLVGSRIRANINYYLSASKQRVTFVSAFEYLNNMQEEFISFICKNSESSILSALLKCNSKLAQNPWQKYFIIYVNCLKVIEHKQELYLQDKLGNVLTIHPKFVEKWELIALCSVKLSTIVAHWDGIYAYPLTIIIGNKIHNLENIKNGFY